MQTHFSKIFFIVVVLSLLMTTPSLSAAARSATPGQLIEQIDFRDVSVGDALKILADQSNLNIIASKDAADIRVTMFLRQVTAMEVIDALSKPITFGINATRIPISCVCIRSGNTGWRRWNSERKKPKSLR